MAKKTKKREITGKAVIYTNDGVKVIDTEINRQSINFNYAGDYILLSSEYNQHAVNYAETKFFRLMIDLMKCAQWQPIHKSNVVLGYQNFQHNNPSAKDSVDYDKHGVELDNQLYQKYKFSSAMIKFVEDHYQ